MAESFKNRVDALTGFASTEDDALSDWLADGAREIISILPSDLLQYCSGATRLDGDPATLPIATDTDIGKILHVTHSNGTRQLPCRLIPAAYAGLASDATSTTYYGTDADPVYWISGTKNSSDTTSAATILEVYPTPTSSKTAFVHHVTYPGVLHSWTGIDNFPDSAEYLVVLYAAIKALQRKMNNKNANLSALSITAVPPDSPTLTSVSYGGASATGVDAVSLSYTNTALSATAPAYTKPYLDDVADTGAVSGTDNTTKLTMLSSITAVPPDVPTLSTVTLSFSTTAPSYTSPSVGGATESLTASITALTGTQLGTDADFLDVSKWFAALGEMIEDDEDIELASAQIEKINAYIAAYNIAMQDALNEFNDDMAEYQMEFQRSVKDADLSNQDDAKKVQKFQAETATYQAEVNSQVQEFQLNSGYQKTALQHYQIEIQNELNDFNKDNAVYQADIQHTLARINSENNVNIQEAQIELQDKMKDADLGTQVSLQNAINTLQAIVADNDDKVAKLIAEMQLYQAEVAVQVQEYTLNLQKDTADYGWLQSQYTQLKYDYTIGLTILKTGNLPTTGGS